MMYRRRSVDGRVVRELEGVLPAPHSHWMILVQDPVKDMLNPSTQVIRGILLRHAHRGDRLNPLQGEVFRCERFVHMLHAECRKPVGCLKKTGISGLENRVHKVKKTG